jgi:outer membrane murein-binding lipoprotein Lpp
MFKKIFIASVLLSTIHLTGCASNASVDQMAYNYHGNSKPKSAALVKSVGVSQIAGGHETNPLWTSQINNANFKAALEQSLKSANLYNLTNNEKYRLNANLLKLDQPYFGLNYTVKCQVHYTLQDIKTNKFIYDKNISSSYTAKVSDSFYAVKRLEMANEGAARENIAELINDLYRLKI